MAEKPKDTKKQKKAEKEAEGDAEEEIVEDPSNADVVTKYRKAGDIANSALQLVIKACTPGAKVLDLCNLGDKYITDETGKVYNNKKKTEKGIGFPTCVSINNVVGHFSPVTSDVVVKENDVVKIDLGVHIDGYVAVVAHTIVVNNNQTVKGRQADVLAAAYTALECAVRLLKPGHKNSEVTEAIGKAAADFKCNAVQGVLSHQMQRFEIDAPKVILNRADVEQKVDEFQFALNEVYALDIVMSTGEGKPKESDDDRTTVFKRSAETVYQLKMQASRAFFSDVKSKFPSFPFTMRAMEDEKKARLGVKECLTHGLVTSYPVLLEKEGEFVAHLKATLLLTANGTLAVTGLPIDRSKLASECKVSEDTQKLLNTSKGAAGGAKKKKGKGKKKEKSEGAKKEGAKKEGAKKEGKSDAPAPASAKKEDKPKEKAADSGKKASKKQEDSKKPAEEAPKSSKKDSKKPAEVAAAAPKEEAPKASTKKDSKKPAEEPKQAAEGSKKKESKKQESGKAAEPKGETPKSSKKVSKGGQ